MIPKNRRWIPCGILAATILVGCADGTTEPDEFSISDLAGSWEGTVFSVTSHANPAQTIDVIAAGGAVHWAMQPQGNFTGTAVLSGPLIGYPEIGVVTLPLSGVMDPLDETTIRVDFIPAIPPIFTTMSAAFTYSGNVFTLTYPDSEYDFDKDGVKEPATFFGSLVRR